MVKGYLLIKLVPGLESSALSQIRATQGVLEVNLVFGQWDAIAIAEANTYEILGPTTQTITNIACQPGQLNMVPNLCCISIDRRIVPGDEANAHSVNDHVKIDDLVVASKVYALSVKL